MNRDHSGYNDEYCTNNTGRNDIVEAKVARDAENIYFYVETAEALSRRSDRNWMMLFLDTDRDKATGWYGYDVIVNGVSPRANKAIVEKNVGNRWEWEPMAETKLVVNDNVLEL